MIKLEDTHKVEYTESDASKWLPCGYKSDDVMVKHFESIGWYQKNSTTTKFFTLMSGTKGFHNRFTADIRPLKKKYKGHTHRLVIEYIPYNNKDIRFNGYINTVKELEEILNGISPGLIERNEPITLDSEKQELLDCIHNFMGYFDTPIARLKFPGEDVEEVRKIGRSVLKKYSVDYRGVDYINVD
jgi:hypothetical protein